MPVKNHDNLKVALEAYAHQNLARLPPEEVLVTNHHFSARFERRMRRLFKRVAKLDIDKVAARKTAPARILLQNRKKLLAAAIILVILVSLFSITAAREAVFSFIVRVYDSFSTIIFNRDPVESDPSTAPSAGIDDIDAMLPTFIPEGYQLSDKLVTDVFAQFFYIDQSNDTIIITMQKIEMAQLVIDTENVQTENIVIGDAPGVYYFSKGFHNVIWQDDLHLFGIISTLDKETLIKMAESTNRK